MTSKERHKKIQKMKTLFWLAYCIGIGGIGLSIILIMMVIKPMMNMTLVTLLIVVMFFMLPIIGSLLLGIYASMIQTELLIERKRIRTEKNKHYVRRFFKCIKQARKYKV